MRKRGFVAKSKCWLKNLLMQKEAIRQPSRELTVETLERIAGAIGIERSKADGWKRGNDVAVHRILSNLHLDHEEIAQREPRAYQNLLRTCLECAHGEKCSRGFERRGAVEIWPSYCPNAMALKAMLS